MAKVSAAPSDRPLTLIATRHKMGYMLNFDRENVPILSKGDLLIIAFMILLKVERFFEGWFFALPKTICQ